MSAVLKRPGLAGWILIGFVLSVAAGLFFGELVAPLQVVGDVFVGLLQMTVLPYIFVSLIAKVGGLPRENSLKMGGVITLFLALSYGLAMVAIILMPQVLPPLESASFFSTSLLTPAAELDFVELFIPTNPFESLAINTVPAVVLFCLCVGRA